MENQKISKENEILIKEYLDMAENDSENYNRFDALLSDDCVWALMPPSIAIEGLESVKKFVKLAMGSRTHKKETYVKITNWFTDGDNFCVEYYHSAFVFIFKVKENVCLVCKMNNGKFEKVNEYVDTRSKVIRLGLKLMPTIAKVKGITYSRTC